MSQKADFDTARISEADLEPPIGPSGVPSGSLETTPIDIPEDGGSAESEVVERLDRYELRSRLSKGGFATVYEAFDPRIKRRVAIKKCSSLDEENHGRFFREAEIAGNLSHPNIVRIFDFGVADGVPFIVQELLGGRDLTDWIESDLQLSTQNRVEILAQIARGIAYAHSRDVIHRDIKPANVRVLDDGSIKLLDFGVATIQEMPSDLTQAGTTVGTAAYLAPEQIHGERPSRTTDMFSFGVLAYELLSGHRPFEGETLSAVLYQIAHQQPDELRVGAIPRRLVRLVHRCLDKLPEHRPESFERIVAELEDVLRDPRLAPPSAETVPIGTYPRGLPSTFGANAAGTEPDTVPIPGVAAMLPMPPKQSPRLADLALDGVRPALRDSSARIQVARRPRRTARFLLATFALLIGGIAYVALGGPLPEPVSEALASAEAQLPEEAKAWLELFRAPEPVTRRQPVPPENPPTVVTEPSVPVPDATQPEPEGDPVTAVVAMLEDQSPPEAPADPVKPEVRDRPAKRRVSATTPATLFVPPSWHPEMVVSFDGGAYQSLDRRRTQRLRPGAHKLSFWLNTGTYEAQRSLDINLEPAETRTVESPLAPPAALAITASADSPSGRVEIDGRSFALPLKGVQVLEPGSHRVTFHPTAADPLGPLTKTVDLRSATAHSLTFDLRRRRAELEYGGRFEWGG
ncbi:MAG: protein kinase [Thermoanaerobaculia bacterium]